MKISFLKSVCFFLTLFTFFTGRVNAQVRINEYSCANVSGVTDNFGNTPDWFELANASTTTAANISGFYLSDDPSNLTKWQFPINTIIPASGYLQVFASGKDTFLVGPGEYHTSFKLTQTKSEQIIVSNLSGAVVDSVTIKPNQENDSWGKLTVTGNNWRLYEAPTPGAQNPSTAGSFFLGYKAKPTFSKAPGFYPGTQSVTITAPQTGVRIKYTFDGSNPYTSSTALTVASPVNVTVSSTSVLRAICIDFPTPPAPVLYDTSFIETNTYFINQNFTFPVVSVCLDTGRTTAPTQFGLFTDGAFDGASMEYFEKDKSFILETVGNTNKHGNDSWAFQQKGFDYEVDDEYGYAYTNKHQFFDEPKLGASPRKSFQKLIFKAAASDNFPSGGNNSGGGGMPCHMRDAFCQSYAFRKNLNLEGRRYEPIIMFINGKYWGVYELREKFDEDYTDYYYNQPDIMELKYWGSYVNNPPQYWQDDWANVYNFIINNSMNNPSNFAMADSMISFSSLIDYIVYNTFVVNSDFINWNTAWWRGTNLAKDKHKWRYSMWDMDNTWGLGEDFSGLGNTGPTGDPCDYSNVFGSGSGPQKGHFEILTKLLQNDTFKSMYINRYADLLNTSLNCDSIMDHFNYFQSMLAPEMPKQIARWASSNPSSYVYSSPNDSLKDWLRNMDNMEAWIQRRCTFIDSAVTACYQVTGPFDFCMDVSPASTGTIELNNRLIQNYVYSGQYFGGVYMTAVAKPVSNYEFDHWEPSGFTLPDSVLRNDTLVWKFDSISCLKAVFRLKPPYDVVGDPIVPTGFSPNGDGNNDYLNVYGTRNATNFQMEIYNRWGQMVFKSNDKTVGWDGTFGGSPAPVGVYAYRFVVTIDGEEKSKKGNVTLIR